MSLRYLVGPVSPTRAAEWQQPRQQGQCLAFHTTQPIDLMLPHDGSWERMLIGLPSDWRPDFVLLDLSYTTVPAWLWQAPVPLVALAPDWTLQWHFLRRFLPCCQRVFTDTAGVNVMHRQGITHALPANLFGLQNVFARPPATPIPSRRDIDILFVGNMHPAVQRDRLPWLSRLVRLQDRWRVHIATNIPITEYRQLLLRSRIVFNRSVRGEWNLRVGEACSCRALLFTEAGNPELTPSFQHGSDCVFYTQDNLDPLLEHYLSHEDERLAIAEAGRVKVAPFTFARTIEQILSSIESDWPSIQQRHQTRVPLSTPAALLARTWQALGANDGGDPPLALDLTQAVPNHPGLRNATGIVQLQTSPRPGGCLSAGAVRDLAKHCHGAAHAATPSLLAGLNLAEALLLLKQKHLALQEVRRLLGSLPASLPAQDLDQPHFPTGYDFFRVEWEKAAWQNAGDAAAEALAKLALVRWRLHSLAASLSGELRHHQEAASARPDLPPTRAALGCALGNAGKPAEAIPHLLSAVQANAFDSAAARALYRPARSR